MSQRLQSPFRRTGRRSVPLASAAALALGTLAIGTGGVHAASVSTWEKVAQCESGGNWAINTGNGFYGGLQFSLSTWKAYGGAQYAAYPNQATEKQQILVGQKVLAGQGQGAWPTCGPSAGLGSDSADPYPGASSTPDPAPSVPAPVVIRGDKGSVLGADGTDMTFTRTATNGHLQLTYLTTAGAWSTTDLSSAAGTPASAGGAPAAFVQQDGTLGAVTGNAANGHVQLTYRAPSGTWATTDLTSYVGTPVTDGKISAITDPDGTLAIYSRDSANGHLQLTYLTSTGTWATTDLTTTVGTPTSAGGAPAGFTEQDGTIGAITADSANGHLRLTYRVPSGTWATTDLTSYVGTPVTDGKVSVMTNSDGTLAIYSRDSADNHLQLTYIAVTTGAWATTDLSASPGTPASAGDSPALFQQKDGTFGAVTADSANGHLRLTYRAPSGTWTTTDLTSYVGTPATDGANPSAVVQNDGTLAIYSHNTANGHLQLTYRAPSGTWTTTDLTTTVGTPAQ